MRISDWSSDVCSSDLSDADVGLHALTDALLGAVGEGDIGTHFPPSEPRWKGAASHLFAEHARDLIGARGGVIDHVDVTLICEEPKVGPHRAVMRARVEIGRAHVRSQVTNAHIVCRLRLAQKKLTTKQ